MKYLMIAMLLLLTGCDARDFVPSYQIDKAKELCAASGGLYGFHPHNGVLILTARCNDGTAVSWDFSK